MEKFFESKTRRGGGWRGFFTAWAWRMAWRDTRASRGKLLLFSCSIVLGVAALTAIGSLGNNLERAINEQAKSLLGADLVLAGRQPFGPSEEQLFASIGGEQSREISFSAMLSFTNSGRARLVQARALSGNFPFYGRLETDPPEAAELFRRGGGVLVEDSLLSQFDARVGDTTRLGNLTARVVGRLRKAPGETVAFATIAPRVYLAISDLAATGLLREGSLARYRTMFKLPDSVDAEKLARELTPKLDQLRLGHNTVEERKRDLGRAMENLYHFLNLAGFVALMLGAVGIASALHAHVKSRLATVAILRCLGATISQSFAIYLLQGIFLGMVGAVLGAALGMGIEAALPAVLADFIPFAVDLKTSWLVVGRSVAVGFMVSCAFALLPLLDLRRVSPLAAVRIAALETTGRRDPARAWVIGFLAAGLFAFLLTQTRNWRVALGFAGGLATVFILLAGVGQGLAWATRRFVPRQWPFPARQGLANLHRPNNRTALMLFSLGLGTFLMLSLFLAQHTLLAQVNASGNRGQPNAILFDIQADQRDAVSARVKSLSLPVLDESPIITMRLASLHGRTIESILADKQSHIPRWALRREYRCTYRAGLRDSEKIIAGRWPVGFTNGIGSIPISVEESIARDLQLKLGDEIEFDVQGVPLQTRVACLREVDWRRVQPNFFIVFPPGVLETAPAMRVLVSRVNSSEESARLQREIVREFPNVAVIDLTLVLETVDAVLTKISLVIRFMALFTVATGIFVMAGALVSGRLQRTRESILLRMIGASRRQIVWIFLVEYVALGFLSAAAGIALAVCGNWALSHFLFKAPFTVPILPLIIALAGAPLLTAIAGALLGRGMVRQSPLAILREAENS